MEVCLSNFTLHKLLYIFVVWYLPKRQEVQKEGINCAFVLITCFIFFCSFSFFVPLIAKKVPPMHRTIGLFRPSNNSLFRPCIQKSIKAFTVLLWITVIVQSQPVYLCRNCDIFILVHLCQSNFNSQ